MICHPQDLGQINLSSHLNLHKQSNTDVAFLSNDRGRDHLINRSAAGTGPGNAA